MKERTALAEIASLFFKLGVIGFGGPAVHISMMEEEVVRKRKWMTHEHFLDLVGATNLIPGPNSTEMTMHIGHERAGWKGLIVAGCCFIFPAVIITAVFGWAYRLYGQLPNVLPFIYGIKPAIIAVVSATMIALGRKALKSVTLAILGAAAAIAVLAGFNEIIVLFSAGAAGMILYLARYRSERTYGIFALTLLQVQAGLAKTDDFNLFLIFLKIGAILYGSGYVLFAFLDAELVNRGLITTHQLTDAIAVGQFTPGPVFSSATFIGWQIGGFPGAMAATAGIFIPSFLFVALLNPLIPRLRRSGLMSAFLDTVNVASITIILSVIFEMGRDALYDWRTTFIAISSFLVTFYFKKLNTAIVIFVGALCGYLFSFL